MRQDSAPRPAATTLFGMAAPAPPTELTTIDSLPIEMLTEVLLRVPTPAALVRAAATKRTWRGAVANDDFLARYRKRQKSTPFLGVYVPRQLAGRPSFLMTDSIFFAQDDERDLYDAATRAFNFGQIRRYQDHRLHDAAFILGRLPVHPDCRLLDCRSSCLLLTRGNEALEVRSPLARDTILLPFPPDPDYYLEEACLLRGHDGSAASFRVVYLQHRREGRNRQARAVEYDSTRKSWQEHPWETLKTNIRGTPKEVMHAGHRIFCTFTGLTSAALLLDTSNMQFSLLPLPSDKHFVIGEGEDNTCCFVESDGCAEHRLRVWQLDEEKLVWDLKKDTEMDQVLGDHVGYYRPRAIGNGIALLCSATTHHHFVVDLNTCGSIIKEKFEFQGQFAYLMQMPCWPPAFSSLDAVGLGSPGRSPSVEWNMSVGSVLASAGCDAPLQGSISEPFSQQDKHDHTAAVEPKSCRQNSPNLPHCADVEGAHHGGSSNQSSKVSSHERPSARAAVTPGFDRTSDVLPTDASECGKRNSVHPQKLYFDPVAPPGRRPKLLWTPAEEAILREAMAKFTTQGDAQISWIRILEYGKEVFNRMRQPADLKQKWRQMKSSNPVAPTGRSKRLDCIEKEEADLRRMWQPADLKQKWSQMKSSNPVAPTVRRKRLDWTEKEEAYLREAMAKLPPQNDAQISWIQILKHGSNVFHKRRRPSDLRYKWKSMNKKCAGN